MGKVSSAISLVMALLVLVTSAGNVWAQCYSPCWSYRVVLDPGHGGADAGKTTPLSGYNEKHINLQVGIAAFYLLYYDSPCLDIFMTRYTNDSYPSFEQRWRLANDNEADLFLSIHHNASQFHNAQGTETWFCDVSPFYGSGEGPTRVSSFASFVQYALLNRFGAFGYPNRNCKDDDSAIDKPEYGVCQQADAAWQNGNHLEVLENLNMAGCLAEASFVDILQEAERFHNAQTDPHTDDEATAYVDAVDNYYTTFSCIPVVPGSFAATGGYQSVTLNWEVIDPQPGEFYRLLRGTSCWAPSTTFLADINQGDPNYTNDGRHYQFVDNTVQNSTEYTYLLLEIWHSAVPFDASATPTGLPVPNALQAPAVTGEDTSTEQVPQVTLQWNPIAGATGYQIYRSRTYMDDCDYGSSRAIVTTTNYTDTAVDQSGTYFYRVLAFNNQTSSLISNEVMLNPVATGVEEANARIKWNVANHPNPFSHATNIEYSHSEPGFVAVQILDIVGREIRRLVNREEEPGSYSAEWDGTDERGSFVGNGVYMYRVTMGKRSTVKKTLLVR